MRAALLALALTIALPARADFDPVRALARARSREHRGIALMVTGIGMVAVAFAGAGLLVQYATCFLCREQVAGGSLMASGATLSIPLLASGITLYRAGLHDERDLGDHLPASFFADRAVRRHRLGRNVALAGAALSAAAITLGAVALWAGYDHKPYDDTLWATMTALASIHGAVGLGLVGGGLALYASGR